MNAISKISKPQVAGKPGRKWWRLRYQVKGEKRWRSKYLGPAEGEQAMSATDVQIKLAELLQVMQQSEGVTAQPPLPTLQEHIDHYVRVCQPRFKATTMGAIQLTVRYLVAYFGEDRRIDTIEPTDADNWFHALATGDFVEYVERYEGREVMCKRGGLADGTIKPHINNARQIFASACKRFPDRLTVNPFGHIRIKVEPSHGKWRYVPYEEVIAAINACSNDKTSKIGWQVFIALCRFAGLRKSEARSLCKRDVNMSHQPPTIKVYASKTARQSGRPSRVVPVLFPKLAELLRQALTDEPDDPLVVSSRLPSRNGSEYKTLERILKRAKVPPWKPAFQVLRACAEVDFLQFGLSERLYTRAIGHSPDVSRKYYLDKFEKTVLEDQERNEYLAAAKIAEGRIVKAAG